MDRIWQLQIVPFSSKFFESNAILACDERSKSKENLYSANDVPGRRKKRFLKNDRLLNILRDISKTQLLYLKLLGKEYVRASKTYSIIIKQIFTNLILKD